jgi:hypothetical protein
MKRILLLLLLAIAAFGCKKENKLADTDTINGTWELRGWSGTIAGVIKTYPPGNGSLIQFNGDSTYKFFANFQQTKQGTYRTVKNGVAMGGQTYDAIYYDNSPSADFMQLSADSLTIGNTYPDGVTSLYVRQK